MNNITTVEERHSDMVNVLMKSGEVIKDSLTPTDCDLIHCILGISGEAGELLDQIKKHTIYRKDLDRNNIIEELGDLEFYMERIRTTLGLTREETLQANYDKLSVRYNGLKYSDKAAQERADKK